MTPEAPPAERTDSGSRGFRRSVEGVILAPALPGCRIDVREARLPSVSAATQLALMDPGVSSLPRASLKDRTGCTADAQVVAAQGS